VDRCGTASRVQAQRTSDLESAAYLDEPSGLSDRGLGGQSADGGDGLLFTRCADVNSAFLVGGAGQLCYDLKDRNELVDYSERWAGW
jgi:hypothetical protein